MFQTQKLLVAIQKVVVSVSNCLFFIGNSNGHRHRQSLSQKIKEAIQKKLDKSPSISENHGRILQSITLTA